MHSASLRRDGPGRMLALADCRHRLLAAAAARLLGQLDVALRLVQEGWHLELRPRWQPIDRRLVVGLVVRRFDALNLRFRDFLEDGTPGRVLLDLISLGVLPLLPHVRRVHSLDRLVTESGHFLDLELLSFLNVVDFVLAFDCLLEAQQAVNPLVPRRHELLEQWLGPRLTADVEVDDALLLDER